MATITVQPNQCIPDIIIQATGSMEAGMQFCADNGIGISDTPAPGTVYTVTPASLALGDTGVLQYLQQNGIVIGTYATDIPFTVFTDESGADEYVSEDGTEVFVME